MAATGSSTHGASVIGLPETTTPEYATFANAAMVRYLDLNDTFHAIGGAHPSDFIPAILAVAEPRHASGRDLVVATYTAYEVLAALAVTTPLRDLGWDYGAFLEIAAAAGAAKVLGLSVAEIANAVSIAITPNLPLGVARSG